MAYTPYEWTVNSYLNPTRMNAIEQGIAAASQAAESASGEFHTIEELIGTQSIAGIGDGTLTGATWKINNDLSDLKNTVTTLNSKLAWKFHKNFTANRSSANIDFPSEYNEIAIKCECYFVVMPKEQIPTSREYIQTGHYFTPQNNGGFAFNVNRSGFNYPTFYKNGNLDDTKTGTIYYR